ncbi:unknown [Feldmannia species virus]|uniref:Uncharacterized protein n=1 Tax=Feldmannia species virus TaxID=39420 RepID=B5LWB2_9PHYC|nr:hypothetical protein FeldSpV_gp023 [Feldmannia species virus]ACH46775.1 unknown [Feldmannia species virus]
MAVDGPTITLAILAIVLILCVAQGEMKGPRPVRVDKEVATSPAPSAELGGRRRLGGSRINCNDVALDSPDFARCATTLGTARTLRNTQKPALNYLQQEYKSDLAPLGTTRGEAFPFTHKSGPIENDRGRLPDKVRHMIAGKDHLGAAVSPASMSREIEMASQKLENVNQVSSNTGGSLNLLNPL